LPIGREPLNLLGVLLVDAGLAAGFLGLISLLRPLSFLGISTRRRGVALIGTGAVLGLAGAGLPAPEQRVAARTSRLDEIIPVYQFSEFHECRVQASPARVHDAVWAVTAGDIRLFHALTWIRSPRLPGRSGRESILNAPAETPILKVATSLVIAPHQSGVMLAGRQDFAALDAPGFAKAVMNFHIEDEGGGWTRLTTETRVAATDPSTRRRFAAYLSAQQSGQLGLH
jgi:hypothetical protein